MPQNMRGRGTFWVVGDGVEVRDLKETAKQWT
jgi:hypothetical protein